MSREAPFSLKIHQTLPFRIGIFLIFTLVMVFVLSTVYLVIKSTKEHDKNLELMALATAEIIARGIEHDMLSLNPQEVQPFFEGLVKTENISAVLLADSTGVVRFSGNPADIGLQLRSMARRPVPDEGRSTVVRKQGEERIVTVWKAFENSSRCTRCHKSELKVLGSLMVDYSFGRFEQEIVDARNLFLITGGASIFLISCILAVIYGHLIQKPLNSLMRMVDHVRRGEMDSRVTLKMKGEFMVLGNRLNEMASNLQAAQEKLKAIHERELAQSEKLASLGQLASSIAHEIRNPLAGIRGVIEVLLTETEEEHPYYEALDMILNMVNRLDKSSMDILSFARPSEPHLVEANLNHILNEVIPLIDNQASEQEIDLELDLARDLHSVWLDPDLSKQVFLNLLLNAVQAMPHGGKLRLKTANSTFNSECLVFIRDTGGGIAPEDLPNIFRPFFTRKTKGTGLGLYVAKQIIESHGGDITVTSEQGAGTKVIVALPQEREIPLSRDVAAESDT